MKQIFLFLLLLIPILGFNQQRTVNLNEEHFLLTSPVLDPSIPFLLTSTGNGTGVSTLVVTVSENTLFTLDGTARFYSDAGGTLNESLTWLGQALDWILNKLDKNHSIKSIEGDEQLNN